MAGIKDVAKRAGVGVGTVSRVLNESGYVSKEVKGKVRAAIEELQYCPDFRAQSLKNRHSKTVGLFVPTIDHPFFSQIAQHIEDGLDRNGYKTMLVCSQGNVRKERSVIQLLAQNRLDGAIFITHHKHDDVLPDYPIVTLDRHLGDGIPCITSDNYDSTFRAIEYLIARGCRKIGYIGGKPSVHSEVENRLQAYRDVVKKHGTGEYICFEEIPHGSEAVFAESYFERFPDLDGIFASGDVMAYCLYYVAKELGKEIPRDLKIVAYDGVMGMWIQKPRITSVRQDLAKLSDAIIEELLKKIKGQPFESKVFVPTEFVVGETT